MRLTRVVVGVVSGRGRRRLSAKSGGIWPRAVGGQLGAVPRSPGVDVGCHGVVAAHGGGLDRVTATAGHLQRRPSVSGLGWPSIPLLVARRYLRRRVGYFPIAVRCPSRARCYRTEIVSSPVV